jgi:hypothetical protein
MGTASRFKRSGVHQSAQLQQALLFTGVTRNEIVATSDG